MRQEKDDNEHITGVQIRLSLPGDSFRSYVKHTQNVLSGREKRKVGAFIHPFPPSTSHG